MMLNTADTEFWKFS